MAKITPPLLGIEVHGTLGDAVTFQVNKGIQIARQRPVPAQPQTWPQIYHRWDYQDFAHLWATLSQAEKDAYKAAAWRKNYAPFNAFMAERLPTLQGIGARLHFDEPDGQSAYDSSGNTNTATLIGTTVQNTPLQRGRHFDGIDDRGTIPFSLTYNPSDIVCHICRVWLDEINWGHGITDGYNHGMRVYSNNALGFYFIDTANNYHWIWASTYGYFPQAARWETWAAWYHSPYIYIATQGEILGSPNIGDFQIRQTTQPLDIARGWYAGAYQYLKGTLDQLTILTRPPDATDIKRWHERGLA